jgi:hypothetical protein
MLARLVPAWFMQRDGTAGVHSPKISLSGGVRSTVTGALLIMCVKWRNIIWDGSTEKRTRRAGHTNLLLPGRPSLRRQDKRRRQYHGLQGKITLSVTWFVCYLMKLCQLQKLYYDGRDEKLVMKIVYVI